MTSESACGEVPEWSNVAVSKTVVGASLPRVRIPVSPPLITIKYLIYNNNYIIFTLLMASLIINPLNNFTDIIIDSDDSEENIKINEYNIAKYFLSSLILCQKSVLE